MNARLRHDLRLSFWMLSSFIVGFGSAMLAGYAFRLTMNEFSWVSFVGMTATHACSRHWRAGVRRSFVTASTYVGNGARSVAGRRSRAKTIVTPPGGWLDRLARIVWSPKTYDRVFKPARADVVHEWRDAEIVGDRWRSRWIRYVRCPISLLRHMIAQAPWSLLKRLIELLQLSK